MELLIKQRGSILQKYEVLEQWLNGLTIPGMRLDLIDE